MIPAYSEIRPYLRSLVREPALPVLSVVLLVLGIGGSAVIFTVIRGALLHPLPVEDQTSLHIVWMRDVPAEEPHVEVAFPLFEHLAREVANVESLAAFSSNTWS